jgi:hypothetical protein
MKKFFMAVALVLIMSVAPAFAQAPPFPIYSEQDMQNWHDPAARAIRVQAEQVSYNMSRIMWQQLPSTALKRVLQTMDQLGITGKVVPMPYHFLEWYLEQEMQAQTQKQELHSYQEFHY